MPRGFHRYALKVVGNMLVKSASVMDNNNFILLATSDISGVAADGAQMMSRKMPGCAEPQQFNTFDELDTYLLNFNGADMLDRGVAEYTTQMRAVRYYIRVFWWHVDLVNFTCWQYIQPHIIGEATVGHHADAASRARLRAYANGSNNAGGHTRFMLDLSHDIIQYGVALHHKERPPPTTGGHVMSRLVSVESAPQHGRCDVCEAVALLLTPGLPQGERRKMVNTTNGFCFGCRAACGRMCPDCFACNWNHSIGALKPLAELTLGRVLKNTREAQEAADAEAAQSAVATPTRGSRGGRAPAGSASKRRKFSEIPPVPTPGKAAASLASLGKARAAKRPAAGDASSTAYSADDGSDDTDG